MFKVNNKVNTSLTINFEHISVLDLMFLSLTLNKSMLAGIKFIQRVRFFNTPYFTTFHFRIFCSYIAINC